jgi:hypothetical protein
MLYSEIIAVRSEIHTKHINTLCGQNVEFVNVKPATHHLKSVPNVSEFNISLVFDRNIRRAFPIPAVIHPAVMRPAVMHPAVMSRVIDTPF